MAATCSRWTQPKGAAQAYQSTVELSKEAALLVPALFNKGDREAQQPLHIPMDKRQRTRHIGGESQLERAWAQYSQLQLAYRLRLTRKALQPVLSRSRIQLLSQMGQQGSLPLVKQRGRFQLLIPSHCQSTRNLHRCRAPPTPSLLVASQGRALPDWSVLDPLEQTHRTWRWIL